MKYIYILIILLTLQINGFSSGSADFEAGDTEYFYINPALYIAAPITLFCWSKQESQSTSNFISLACESSSNNYFYIQLYTDYKIYAVTRSATQNKWAVTTATSGLNSWYSYTAEFETVSSRYAWINSSKSAQETTTVSPSGICNTTIGATVYGSGVINYADGLIAYVCIWGSNLTDDELNEVQLGIPPIYVQTNNCKGFYPLTEDSGNALDKSGNGYDMTETSGTIERTSDSPPRIFIPIGGQ